MKSNQNVSYKELNATEIKHDTNTISTSHEDVVYDNKKHNEACKKNGE